MHCAHAVVMQIVQRFVAMRAGMIVFVGGTLSTGGECRTRNASVTDTFTIMKILLSPTPLSTAAASNNLAGFPAGTYNYVMPIRVVDVLTCSSSVCAVCKRRVLHDPACLHNCTGATDATGGYMYSTFGTYGMPVRGAIGVTVAGQGMRVHVCMASFDPPPPARS